jgi:acyl-CoA synthetase (AMP-forming)/AMP-acid ligase II
MSHGTSDGYVGAALVAQATSSTIASLFAARARIHPARTAIEDAVRIFTYREVADRTRRLAGALAASGVTRGTPIAILSENRPEYLEVILAAARLGAIVACQSWRLAAPELAHCLDLVSPACTFVSPRHAERLPAGGGDSIVFGPAYERLVMDTEPVPFEVAPAVEAEDAILILYTSGTTGRPKGAVLGHRAQIVRNLVTRAEFGVAGDDTFAAWSPLYHMGALENSLGTLMSGGSVIVVDGFDKTRLAEIVATRELGWLPLMPGMVGALAAELRERRVKPKGVKICGVMADLVPPAEIAEITALLGAPYANTFGATETGCPPCSSSLIPIGVAPLRLSKQVSPFCEVRLVDAEDRDVSDGVPGELVMRGPTLFSGYWRADEANAHDFRGGWFHMGDVFVRNQDGTLDFVDRVKYLIKTGGESVYPAEIERVLLQDPRVAEAAVVRRADARWGEVPIAFVARREGPEGQAIVSADLFARCRAELAGFKQPRGIVFVTLDSFPRSASGKVQRHDLEKRLEGHTVEEPRK